MTVINTRNAETINIGQNGSYDVARYTTANVNTPAAPDYYIGFTKDANGVLQEASIMLSLVGLTDIGTNALQYKYYGNENIVGEVSFSPLINISGSSACFYAFSSCSKITGVDLSTINIVGKTSLSYAFSSCIGLKNANLSNITSVDENGLANCFYRDSNLLSFDLSSLMSIKGNALSNTFGACTSLTTASFNSLCDIKGTSPLARVFDSCVGLTDVYLPAINSSSIENTNTFGNFVRYITGCTIHFPNNLDPQGGSTVISSLSGYPNFGGTNTVLAFDLPATNTLTGVDTNTYVRNPKYDTAGALAWKQGTPTSALTPAYYTSGTTDPQVNDTIYSDSACTTAVTTISSIS